MLADLWARHPGQRCVVGIKGKRKLHYWFDSTDDAMAKALELDAAGWNAYFAPALFDPEKVERRRQDIDPHTGKRRTGREQSCAYLIPALWLDLDCGEDKDYADQPAAARALADWLTRENVPPPTHVINSGYGLHVYWRLTSPVQYERWLPVAKHLKQACLVGGLVIDPTRTADAASLMRAPGTHNYKHRAKAPTSVLACGGAPVDLQQFRASLPVVGPQGSVAANPLSDEWNVDVKHPPGDAEAIASQCGQMGMFRFHKGKVPEPLWRAGLSILWRCEGAESLIHDWSTGDPRYDPAETQQKAEGTGGPATCRLFAELNPEGCAGCPHAGKVTSPILLAYAEASPAEGEPGPTKVYGFTVTDGGVFKDPGRDGGPLTKIADFAVWIEEARELESAYDEQMRATLVLAWNDVRGQPHRRAITQAHLHDPRQWVTWLADANLISFVHPPLMSEYISRMHKTRFREHGSRIVYDSLGWYRDHQLFVLGTQGITEDGPVDVVVDAKSPLASLASQGSLEEWRQVMMLLADQRFREQAFGLLLGFAAPLLDIVSREGAVVAFTGLSGRGKTLAAHAALSIFGASKPLEETAGSTHKALGMYLGLLRHVPALVDEVTHMPDKRLRDLIYMAANGRDHSTLTRTREFAAGGTWRTITILTSNHSIVDREQKDIEEAHRRRLVEVPVPNGPTKAEAETFYQGIMAHHGVAAAPYLQVVIQHRDRIPALFALVGRHVDGWGYSNPADRFGAWTCTAALLGGVLAQAAGVLPFDPLPVVEHVARNAAAANRDRIMTPEDQAREALFEFLTTHSKQVCVWARGRLAADDIEDPVARIDEDVVWVRAGRLNEALDEQRIFRRALQHWFDEVAPYGPLGRVNRTLSPGTPAVKCYGFSRTKLGWYVEELKGGS